jgi:small subunit ribosomal protein S1
MTKGSKNYQKRKLYIAGDDYNTGEDFSALLEQNYVDTSAQEGKVIQGEVIAIENDLVIIDIKTKNEGYIPLKEFQLGENPEQPVIGEEIEVYIEKIDTKSGKTLLSREKAVREKIWDALDKKLNSKETIEGIIFGKVKGGFTVDLNGIIAFLPGSQVDIRPIKDISPLMGIKQPFQILKIDRIQGNIVVSRRAILEETRDQILDEVLSHIQEGQVLEGVVKNITDYGAFIDLGKVDGLLHVTDISWGRINHPSEVLTLGQKVQVQVIKFNEDSKRISLGMKQLEDNPWKDIEARYPKGQKRVGKVTNITDYGVFVELEPGIEGLVHVSEISWTKNNVNPKKLVIKGQEVSYIILDIDPEKHRISLGMKQCIENPWEIFEGKYKEGSVVEGEIKNIVDFGLFVGFDGDIDGLVHISDLTWEQEKEVEELKKYEKGQKVTAKVLAVDASKERISLGVKQLQGADPYSQMFDQHKKGDVVTCVVKEVTEDGIDVEVGEGIKCFIRKSDLSMDKVEQRPERFAVDDRVDAQITNLDKKTHKLSLSIKALEVEQQKKTIKEYGSADSGASLGDILGEALNQANKK